ncbi:peptide chain release factor 1 [Buchnera aphidicola str. Bp (Baizongia pistaciae)]|uniref:Peptide chain release factor 1 n=1 Tax=Buchnera aphidicola subsp. Baizongia pistaciae (strain Bp) TaxID=224915 RepID=RF1_BUCBP|nr:peptide chain release factor 1 [Buchnera aphidicola]P59456.1 RecName: Full=Peptide chain release factor 1; Short=RF-1 [Buchnera aphidicola str. Bp (Baizongia pistaciae)]AAO26894.1 peptide chain release factor 1 [Buchnera aphidicola str. Bp (Baizongia pistaciae)]
MKSSMMKKLESLHRRYEEIESMLSDRTVISNQEKFRELSQEYLKLSDINYCFVQWKNCNHDVIETKLLLLDSELHDVAEQELQMLSKKMKKIETEIQVLLLPCDPNDQQNCFLEIRSASGGDEAAIFSGDLFRMYIKYSEFQNWKTNIIHMTHSLKGGYKDIIVKITGKGSYGKLKFESGGHRVQRVPKTESQGRVHTSTCIVAVIPVVPKKEIEKVNINDLKIDTFRSSGAGGQHVNTTDSAVRITHIPSGQVVECQDERSQHKNKAKALSVLVSRIKAAELYNQRKKNAIQRRDLLGTGMRSDRNRTYNFAQNRVTDHRINLVVYCLDEVLDGKLDVLIEPIIQEHNADVLSNLSNIEFL